MIPEKQFFPASIIDETAYIMEEVFQTSLTGTIILTLEGEVRTQQVEEALDACLRIYPKFKCILVNNYPSLKHWFRYCWEFRDTKSQDILKEITTLDQDHSPQSAFTYCIQNHFLPFLDLSNHAPIQVILIRQPSQVSLLFTFHHAAIDGLGVILFMQRFIQLYEKIWHHEKNDNDSVPDFTTISQPEILVPWKNFSLKNYYAYVKQNMLLKREPPAQVLFQGERNATSMLLAAVRELNPSHLGKIKTIVKKYDSTFNDYLLAALFQTIKKWNQERNVKSERIYINVPVNLRTEGDRTVGNVFSGFNVSVRSEVISDKRQLLRLVRNQLLYLLKTDMARTIVHLSWILKFIPLTIKMLLFKHLPKTYYPTATLSNIGICNPNPTHQDKEGFHYMGPARISNISFLTSAVPWPQIVTLTYNNRLAICLSVSPTYFSQEFAERLLDSYVRELTP